MTNGIRRDNAGDRGKNRDYIGIRGTLGGTARERVSNILR
jgi:hypothetical protein